MGCCNSVEAEAAMRRSRPQKVDSNNNGGRGANNISDNGVNNTARFDQIVNGAKMIAATSNMMPIVCLTRDTFPIITSYLHLEDSTPTEIQLPIVAGSVYKAGRVICFAQLQFLSSKTLHVSDTARLVLNSLVWICGGNSSMTHVLALGFDKQTLSPIVKSLQELGFFVEGGNSRSNLTSYKALIIPSSIDLEDEAFFSSIVNYVENGGGIAVYYHHAEIQQLSMPINKLLSIFGLSYTYCLLNDDLEEADNIQVPPSFAYVRDSNFVPISAHFKAVVKQNNIDTSTLDDLVTTLRYYIMVCDETYSQQLVEIANFAWEFLTRTNYTTEDGICPDIKHGIVVVLLQDLYAKLPIDKVQAIPEHTDFPGETGDVKLEDHEINVTLRDETWISTGLWLPANTPAKVISAQPISDVHVQIGSQNESLLTKQGPWKRWPSVVSAYPIESNEVNVGTPFGGIVYLTVNSIEPVDPFPADFTFSQFCKHPRYVTGHPEIWEETKDIEVPWGEIDVGSIIFTVPSESIRQIKDFDIIHDKFQTIVSGISNYMSYQPDRPYRAVFDVELTDEGPNYGYPLVFHVDEIPGILMELETPTVQLFKAVSLMTIVSLREECFDITTETAIATVATAVIFQELFQGFNPFEFNGITLPTLFHELWEIHSHCNAELIPNTLSKFQNPDYPVSEVPEDMWIAFVREMCRIGRKDFTKLLERSRPIPLNISISLQGLPPYQAVEP